MTSSIKDIDRGWNRLAEAFTGLKSAYVSIGMHSDADLYLRGQDEPANVAQIASFHEFGYGVPARPFFRPTIDGNQNEYADVCQKALGRILDGKLRIRQGLTLVGLKVQADVRQAITDLQDPPLAESTIRAKGSTQPLIDTGHMRKSVTFKVNIQGEPGQSGSQET